MKKMTMKERILAVIAHKEFDRIPFVQYDGINVAAADNEEIWSVIGKENLGLLAWSSVYSLNAPNCQHEIKKIERNGMNGTLTMLHTPKGTLTEERYFEPVFNSSAAAKHFVTTLDDYEILRYYLKDISVVENYEGYIKKYVEYGDIGIPMVTLQRNPFQQMWIQWADLNDFSFHMADDPDLVEECLNLLGKIQIQGCEIVARLTNQIPIHYINFPDNITAPVIGENNFRKYCMPYYMKMSEMIEGKDIVLAVHMDGDLKPLWSAIGESKAGAIDSFSPPPDNDTTAGQAAAMWPEKKLFLNFPSSVHLLEKEDIYDKAMEILNQAGHTGRLWMQISENVPPNVWRKSYPQIIKAIEDFGTPKFI